MKDRMRPIYGWTAAPEGAAVEGMKYSGCLEHSVHYSASSPLSPVLIRTASSRP